MRADVDHFGLFKDLCAVPLGKEKIILGQGVLGVISAAHHAAATEPAAGPLRSLPIEEGIGDAYAGFPKEYTDIRGAESMLHAVFPRHAAKHVVSCP